MSIAYETVGIREASEKAEVEKGTMPLCAGCSAYVSIATAQVCRTFSICKHCFGTGESRAPHM